MDHAAHFEELHRQMDAMARTIAASDGAAALRARQDQAVASLREVRGMVLDLAGRVARQDTRSLMDGRRLEGLEAGLAAVGSGKVNTLHDRSNTHGRKLKELTDVLKARAVELEAVKTRVGALTTMVREVRGRQTQDLRMLLRVLFAMLRRATAEQATCCICRAARADTVLAPCGHHAFCGACVGRLRESSRPMRCPVCREPVEGSIKMSG